MSLAVSLSGPSFPSPLLPLAACMRALVTATMTRLVNLPAELAVACL